MKKILIVLAVAVGMVSCQPKGRIYVEHSELSPDLEWLKKDIKEFKVPIENNKLSYNLSLSYRYAYGYQFNILKVTVTETSPSGKQTVNNYELKIKDDTGEYIGDPGYDIWDSEHLIEPNKTYTENGVYTYVIEHNMPTDPVNMAMEIGIALDKVEM